MKLHDVEYEFLRGSDLQRDGMFLEVAVKGTNPLRQLAEVFYSDLTGQFSLSCFERDVPIEVIERLLLQARESLPPAGQQLVG
ncbi:hypothetical protein [Roseateles chitosanitabidus]|uniref:hypothetical protein n=1 Tax=Roseateles chitosanitabidus TaxID=65048 RepID=UPI00082FD1A4|nr:hypothetical protein [Roseateles chitosanitabidus]